jgi:nesprin-1
LHFRSGVGGDSKVTEAAEEIIKELDQLTGVVKEQSASLEACLAQLDQYQQVIYDSETKLINISCQTLLLAVLICIIVFIF